MSVHFVPRHLICSRTSGPHITCAPNVSRPLAHRHPRSIPHLLDAAGGGGGVGGVRTSTFPTVGLFFAFATMRQPFPIPGSTPEPEAALASGALSLRYSISFDSSSGLASLECFSYVLASSSKNLAAPAALVRVSIQICLCSKSPINMLS